MGPIKSGVDLFFQDIVERDLIVLMPKLGYALQERFRVHILQIFVFCSPAVLIYQELPLNKWLQRRVQTLNLSNKVFSPNISTLVRLGGLHSVVQLQFFCNFMSKFYCIMRFHWTKWQDLPMNPSRTFTKDAPERFFSTES